MLNNRSPSPFSKNSTGYYIDPEALQKQKTEPLPKPVDTERTNRDFKHLMESSQIIDEIFHKRQLKVQAERKAEEER